MAEQLGIPVDTSSFWPRIKSRKRKPPRKNKNIKYVCSKCSKSYDTKGGLIQHYKIHLPSIEEQKPYQCSYCLRRFTQNHNKKKHENNHTNPPPKPFQCNQCNKRFGTKYNCTQHKRTHQNNKPFKCRKCKTRFTRKSTLTNHIKYHCFVKDDVYRLQKGGKVKVTMDDGKNWYDGEVEKSYTKKCASSRPIKCFDIIYWIKNRRDKWPTSYETTIQWPTNALKRR